MEVKCKRCNYSWDYQGNSEWYISCPKCKTTMNIRTIKNLKSQKAKNE